MVESRPHIDLLCVGETMAMITPDAPESIRTATQFRMGAGGAESNVAMYAALNGVSTAWLSRLGTDPTGSRVLDEIAAAGVLVHDVERIEAHPTGLYLKSVEATGTQVYYYRSGSAASTMGPAQLDQLVSATPRTVHTSGITVALSESCHQLVQAIADHCRNSSTRLCFDVNYRPALWPVARAAAALRPLAQSADILFVGLDEANTLWGTVTPDDVHQLFPQVGRLIVKDSDVGATEYVSDGSVTFVPALKIDVLEAVGAGDAFAGGYLVADIEGFDSAGRLRNGHQFAATALSTTADVNASRACSPQN